jgi:hypothetical protein
MHIGLVLLLPYLSSLINFINWLPSLEHHSQRIFLTEFNLMANDRNVWIEVFPFPSYPIRIYNIIRWCLQYQNLVFLQHILDLWWRCRLGTRDNYCFYLNYSIIQHYTILWKVSFLLPNLLFLHKSNFPQQSCYVMLF